MSESWCYECNPSVLETTDRPKFFLSLCPEHLALVLPISDEEIEKALDEVRKVADAMYPQYIRPMPRWP